MGIMENILETTIKFRVILGEYARNFSEWRDEEQQSLAVVMSTCSAPFSAV